MYGMKFVIFSSRRRHTRCALVTGVQTCALPICLLENLLTSRRTGFAAAKSSPVFTRPREESVRLMRRWGQGPKLGKWTHHPCHAQIGRASCRERVCQYV